MLGVHAKQFLGSERDPLGDGMEVSPQEEKQREAQHLKSTEFTHYVILTGYVRHINING